MFTGTNYFRELAIYYEKHNMFPYQKEYNKIYADINKGQKKKLTVTFDMFTYNMQEFAKEMIDKAVNGDNHGDTYITGEHWFYLNNTMIEMVTDKKKKTGRRKFMFPAFWDEDWRYFIACDIAQHGLPEGREFDIYDKLCRTMDIEAIRDLDNLQGGLDVVWAKSRGVGASWKGGAKTAYNTFLAKDSNTFIAAESEPYLVGDGILNKYDKIRSFIQSNCWWLRKHFYKESLSDFEFSTGYKDEASGANVIKGFNSSVIGITIDGEPDKIRGKRGDILLEEFGSFPSIEQVWVVTEASVNEGGIVYGQRRGFGTGGDKNGNFELLSKMWDNPRAYRLMRFKDAMSDFDSEIPFFTNRSRNITYKDADGNTNKVAGESYHEEVYQKLIESGDTSRAIKYLAEFPRKGEDMFLDVETDVLPKALAKNTLDFLVNTDYDRKVSSYGSLSLSLIGEIVFTPEKVLPFEDYPIKKGENHLKKGCVQIIHRPFKINGVIPKERYLIAVDAFAQDVSSDSDSIGSIKVYEQPNKDTPHRGDMFVAYFNTRPDGHDSLNIFARDLFYLAEYYNAKIMLENDQVGDIVSYAKTHKDSRGRSLTRYLEEQPDLSFDEAIATKKKMKRQFGMNMTIGRKLQGLKYYNDWLLKERGRNKFGEIIRNVDMIFDRGELREIMKFKVKKNADRISSSIICMYHAKESENNFLKKTFGNKVNLLSLDKIKFF